ncbi:MAG: AAA family ATPase, partial [Sciscionella sp.]
MRLHTLRLQAFGPYPGTEVVDFDALGADGLFLLHGDTGAGKTTVLDAVAFALFGSVPGARGEVKRLRCDTARPEDATEVSLELTVAGSRLRISRNPEYERPKKRGEGTTTQPAKGSLLWLVSPLGKLAEPLTRLDEIGRAVSALLGMSAQQFFQVVLLPQGEFARFLRADTGEREQLLENLFATHRFGAVEEWFRERRRTSRAALERQRGDIREVLARIAQESEVELPTDPGTDWLDALCTELAERATTAATAEQAALDTAAAADEELASGVSIAERQRRLTAARGDLDQLQRQHPELAALGEELTAAQAVAPVLAVHRRLETERTQAHAASERVAAAEGQLRVQQLAPLLDLDGPQLREQAAQHSERAGSLAALVEVELAQQRDRRRLAELVEQHTRAEKRIAECEAEVAALPDRLADARAQVERAVTAAASRTAAQSATDEAAELLRLADTLPAAQRTETRAQDAHRAAIDAHQNATEALQRLRERRLAGMAAELAGGLSDGAACPVCGSQAHPSPAAPGGDPVTEEAERQAEASRVDAETRRTECAASAQAATIALRGVQERLEGRERAELATEHAVQRAEVDALAALAAQREDFVERVRSLEEATARWQRELAAASRSATVAAAELDNLRARLAENEQRITTARGDHPDIATRRDALLAAVGAIEELRGARDSAAMAQRGVIDRVAELDAALGSAGFTEVGAALAAQRDAERIEAMRSRLDAAERRRIAAESVLADPDIRAVAAHPAIDLDGLRARARQCRSAERAAAAQAAAALDRSRRVAQRAAELAAKWLQLGPALAAHEELDALTDVVNGNGQNAKRMSLRSYVLAARLEEVALAATHRLRAMSEGRYSFVHSDSAGPRGTRGGLGLDVLDDYSGMVRSAKTLSGGESFLASLSLALGLADVVAAETSGAVLDTLFVDEGFGSLDPETLEEVMNTIDELRAGGRVVGLVSHVDELRQRIP